jgi:hypothetical protein
MCRCLCAVLLAAMSAPHVAASLARCPTPPAAAVLSIAELDAAYDRGELRGKQRDAARKRKERREKTAAAVAALHLPAAATAAAIRQLSKPGVKVEPATDTNKKKGQRERTAACQARQADLPSVALQSSPVAALRSRPSLQSNPVAPLQSRPAATLQPRPVAASTSRPVDAAPSPVRVELNTQDLDEILGYSSTEIRKEPELREFSLPPVHPPSIPDSMQLPLPSISPSPTYDYLPATSSFPAAAAAAASSRVSSQGTHIKGDSSCSCSAHHATTANTILHRPPRQHSEGSISSTLAR